MKVGKLGVIIGVMLLCSICFGDDLVGRNAPEITIRQWITKNPPSLERLRGSVYVVEFWAMWCSPCVKGVPDMIALYNKYKDRGLNLIALSQDKSAKKLRRFVRKKGINYHVAIDNGTADWFGVKGYPTVAVVNHLGKVVWQGYPWEAEFEKTVAKAMEKASPPLLAGIDLGPFDHLKGSLCGGSEFAKAYGEVEFYASGRERSDSSAAARRIVATIDKRISQQISRAERLQSKDIVSAYYIYEEIVARYDGIEAVEPAKAAYLKLKKHKGLKARLLASTKYHKGG